MLEDRLAEITFGHRGDVDPRHDQTRGIAGPVGIVVDRADRIRKPDVLPVAGYLRDGGADGLRVRRGVGELLLLDGTLESQVLDRRVADRDDVARLEEIPL